MTTKITGKESIIQEVVSNLTAMHFLRIETYLAALLTLIEVSI